MAGIAGAAKETARFEEYLDRAADEVFGTMMGVSCKPLEDGAAGERESIAAVIGLAGAMSGSLVLHSGSMAAMRMAERLAGVVPEGVDAMVRDAFGEVCNMLAGAWKGFDPVLSSGCLLSTPTIVAGSSYELFSERAPLRVERSYRFEELTFSMTVFFELAS
jgi:chemotaxis protein CheX